MRSATRYYNIFCLALLLPILSLACPGQTLAADEAIAEIKTATGTVEVLRKGSLPAVAVKNGTILFSGDVLRTKGNGIAEIHYKDSSLIKVASGSRVEIGEYTSGGVKRLVHARLARGKLQAEVNPNSFKAAPKLKGRDKFEVHTPTCVSGVKGSGFFLSHHRGVSTLLGRSGTIYAFNHSNPTRIVTLTTNLITHIVGNQAPTRPRTASTTEIRSIQGGFAPPSGSQQGGQSSSQQGGQSSSGQQNSQSNGGQQGDQSSSSQQSGQSSNGQQSDHNNGNQQTGQSSTGTTNTPVALDVGTVGLFASTINNSVSIMTSPTVVSSGGTILPTTSTTNLQPTAITPITTLPPPPPPPPPPPTKAPVSININFN